MAEDAVSRCPALEVESEALARSLASNRSNRAVDDAIASLTLCSDDAINAIILCSDDAIGAVILCPKCGGNGELESDLSRRTE